MGLFSKVKKGFKKVVGGVVKGVTKVFDAIGIDLAKIMDNKWVQGGLMAVSIFTGGVAIMNGVMTGFAQATAAQAAQQTVAGAAKSTFLDTFVAGAKGFMEGVGQGIMNPLDTAGDLAGQASSAMGLGGETMAASGLESTGEVLTGAPGPSAASQMNQTGGALEPLSSSTAVPPTSPGGMPAMENLDPSTWGGADGSMLTADGHSMGYNAADPMSAMGNTGGADALGNQIAAGEKGWLESLAGGAKDFVSSPTGMMTAANAVQGWAQGSMIEKRWDEMAKEEKNRRKSWQDFDKKGTSNYNIPSLSALRERTAQLRDRGNQAQAKYGY